MSEIESRVKAIIVDKLGVEESEVKPEASFTNDLGADSLDTVELIMEFEKEFGISSPDDKAEKIGTVADAVAYISPSYTPYCFQKRNRWMVDRSSRLIAVYNGTSGGTKNTIDYARKQGCDVIL